MAPPYVAQGVLVRLVWGTGGVPSSVNVYGALNPSGVVINQALANALGSAIKTAFTASGWDDAVHATSSLLNVGVRSFVGPGQPEFIDVGAAVPGAGIGKHLPPQVALCVTLRTALVGKSNRGRSYLGELSDALLDVSGAASASAPAAAQTWVSAIQTAIEAQQLDFAVLSRKTGTGQSVTLVQCRDAIFDTVRKRAIPGI